MPEQGNAPRGEPARFPSRPIGSAGSYRALLVAAILGPALLFAAMAWTSWERVKSDAASQISRMVDLLHEHALKQLESDELTLARIDDRVAGASWPELIAREKPLHDFLQTIVRHGKDLDAAFIADAEGELQALSRSFPVPARSMATPTPANIRDRAYFLAARISDEVIVDGPFKGRVSGETIVDMARRLSSPDGTFRGVAVLVRSQRNLTDFWKTFVAPGDTVSLVRDDGVVLVRYPEIPLGPNETPNRFSPGTMARIVAAESGEFDAPPSVLDGVARTIGFRKLPGYPIYTVYAVDRRNLLSQWYASVAAFGGLAAAAAASLVLTALAVIRRARGEEAALARAESTAGALRESEERYRALYEKTPVPMHVCDADGHLLAVSERWLELLGYERDEVLGRSVREFHAPQSAALFGERWQEFLAAGSVRDLERQYVRKDGEVLDILVSSRVEHDRAGDFLRVLGVLVDVTGQKRMAAALHQAQKMEAVGQITGGVAHDFNNLLTVVIGNLDMAAGAENPDRVRSCVASALRAAQRGGRLTQQLLAFSRRQMLQPEIVDPNRLIRDFAQLIRQACGETVELRMILASSLAPCRIDRAQFEAAILNLVVNSRDAMPRGGTITLETRNVEITAAEAASMPELKPGQHTLIIVSDTGEGMPPSVLAKAIEPFFTTKEIGRGSGLGLSMVYGFVQQSDGHMSIQSQPGVGTTIKIHLPCTGEAAARAAPGPTSEHAPGGSEAILVVEDNEEVRQLAVTMIEALGYDVAVAADAGEALAVLGTGRRVDLIFTDIVMPGGMMGDQLAREAQRLRPGVKVLLTTGYAAQFASGAAPETGSFPVISKPYRRAELAAKLREALTGAPVQSTA